MGTQRWIKLVFIVTAVVMVSLPLLFWWTTRSNHSCPPEEAGARLAAAGTSGILLDVRSRDAFEALHLDGAINIPAEELSHDPGAAWRKNLEGKSVIMVICRIGASSAAVVERLRKAGFPQAVSVEGGMDAWLQGSGPGRCRGITCAQPVAGGSAGLLPRQDYTLLAQVMVTLSAFAIKPLYLLMSLLIVILLWNCPESDLASLRRSMAAFFLGEMACAVNFLFLHDQSRLWEYFHSIGMLIAFGFFFYAAMEAADARLIHFSNHSSRCALLAVCGQCYKNLAVRCRLYRLFLFVPLAAAVLPFMLFTAETHLLFFQSNVLGTEIVFGHPLVPQLFEIRICPLLAIPFLLGAWLVLWRKREGGFDESKILLAMGLGPLSFGLMRFLIYWGYSSNPLWGDFWEEATEFLFIAFLLWLILGTDHVRTWWTTRRNGTITPPVEPA